MRPWSVSGRYSITMWTAVRPSTPGARKESTHGTMHGWRILCNNWPSRSSRPSASGRTTFTATLRPSSASARCTVPKAPLPACDRSLYLCSPAASSSGAAAPSPAASASPLGAGSPRSLSAAGPGGRWLGGATELPGGRMLGFFSTLTSASRACRSGTTTGPGSNLHACGASNPGSRPQTSGSPSWSSPSQPGTGGSPCGSRQITCTGSRANSRRSSFRPCATRSREQSAYAPGQETFSSLSSHTASPASSGAISHGKLSTTVSARSDIRSA
mmetsp:Transcript_31886/g.83646  ORF Transcript_31886/g.83646 Transcript_31886/m.83646 type:complete len:272 (-) Transcript_31886:342-1157(-)